MPFALVCFVQKRTVSESVFIFILFIGEEGSCFPIEILSHRHYSPFLKKIIQKGEAYKNPRLTSDNLYTN